jgi:acyl-CoA thioesterase-1
MKHLLSRLFTTIHSNAKPWSLALIGLCFSGLLHAQNLLVVGDSISAEYGLKRGSGWVQLLSERLSQSHPDITVINASISGDTSSGGRARLAPLLKQHQPRWMILELGANDALRGLPLTAMRDNLSAMIKSAQAQGAQVLLVGIQVPPNYGKRYTAEFEQSFAQVAEATGVPLVPFLLRGVADVPDALRWFQTDRIHPNEAAQPKLLGNVWPELEALL